MFRLLDSFLDSITMYRLTLYVLIGLVSGAVVFSFFGILSYSPTGILITCLVLIGSMWIANKLFAFFLKVPTNVESVYISALILSLILSPAKSTQEMLLIIVTGFLAVSSKFLLSIRKKHIFNPAAIALVISGFFLHYYASWWIGTAIMLPLVIIGGFLIVKKLQKTILVVYFLLGVCAVTAMFAQISGISIASSLYSLFFDSAIVFFATIMLTEPLTAPPTKKLQIMYGALVVFLIDPHAHVGSIYSTPELTLAVANIFSYIVSPKQKLILKLKEKIHIGMDQIDFVFTSPEKIIFTPGQYMEWTLQHPHTDSRGNRRYFSLASSPTEDTIRLGVKFYSRGSSYKKALHAFSDHEIIVAGSLAGDFTLPKDTKKKLVFIAGGIGITPFRSMTKYLIDRGEKRDIVLLYSNKIESEIMYEDIFAMGRSIGVTAVYTLTDIDNLPPHWKGETGRISTDMIKNKIPDFKNREFYLSGPHDMVTRFEETLQQMGIHQSQIKKDFFPGFV